jgi:hypothetical protein
VVGFAVDANGAADKSTAPQQDKQPPANASVSKNTYAATDSGVRIVLTATVTGGDYTGINWVQTVTTNSPTSGNPANVPYPDRDPDQTTPFYLNPKEQQQAADNAKRFGASTIFSDRPSRNYDITNMWNFGVPIQWRADLSLVGINRDGSFDRLKTFNYGFTLDGNGVHALPLKEVK